MSSSPKYDKLVEYLKTHYTYQLKLNSFSLGDRESTEDAVKRQVYGDVMEFIENLEEQEELREKHKNNLIPLDFSATPAADTVSLDFRPDVVTFGSADPGVVTFGADTIDFSSGFAPVSTASSVVTAKTQKDWQDFWKNDGFTLTGNPNASPDTLNLGLIPGGMGEDHISLGDGPQYYEDEHGLVAGELPEEKDDK